MTRVLATFLLMGLCIAWPQEKKKAAPNTLTSEERQQGFELLFDGKSLDKFNVSPGEEKIFLVSDGAIKTNSSGAGATLLTREDYANFVLKLEFRAHPDVNSGIMLRNPRPHPPAAAPQGYEVQIRDRNPGKYSGGSFLTGSIVNIAKAPADAKIRPGEWNSLECSADGDHLVVTLNGKRVAEGRDSKLTNGAIGLQLSHPEDARGADIEFRNLKVKRLP